MNLIEYNHKDFLAYQQALLSQCLDLSPLYQPLHLQYYQHYFKQEFVEGSFCLELGKKPLLLVMVTKGVEQKISYYNLPIRLVWLNSISDKEKKGALKVVLKQFKAMQKGNNASLYYQEQIQGPLSDFSLSLLKDGYQAHHHLCQKIDLSLPLEQLMSNVRKIYRANIRWGQAKLTFKTLNQESCQQGDIEAFRQLHRQVSGVETRNQQSWQAQESMILAGQAFAIYGYLNDELVSAGFFIYNENECYYGVGAYQRELFDKPLSHVSVWQAIILAKQLGCCFFTMGDAVFPYSRTIEGNKLSEKELSISHFKQGFGGSLYSQLSLTPSL